MDRSHAAALAAAIAACAVVGCPGEPFPEPAPTGCVTDGAAGEHRLQCGGLRVDVSVPEPCLGAACGVILDVHGWTMDGDAQDANTGLRALGRQRDYIVVQPTAPPGFMAETSWSDADDAAVLAALDDVADSWHADPGRVHVTGFSQGGLMTWRMICHEADRFASAAPAAAAGVQLAGVDGCDIDQTPGCAFAGDEQPSTHLPILYLHGHHDALVDFQCAEAQRQTLVDAWGLGDPETLSTDAGHSRTRHTDPDGTPFEFLEHEYVSPVVFLEGHCFPGSDDHEATLDGQLFGFACEDEDTFVWGEEVIDFFDRHHHDLPADS